MSWINVAFRGVYYFKILQEVSRDLTSLLEDFQADQSPEKIPFYLERLRIIVKDKLRW